MQQLKAYRDNGVELTRGELLVDFRGDEWYFWAASRATLPGRSGKIMVIRPENWDGTSSGANEFYSKVFPGLGEVLSVTV